MCTESSKDPNNHVCVVFGKFKSLRTPCRGTTFKSRGIQPPRTRSKKEQQYVLNKFINYVVVNDQIYL